MGGHRVYTHVRPCTHANDAHDHMWIARNLWLLCLVPKMPTSTQTAPLQYVEDQYARASKQLS